MKRIYIVGMMIFAFLLAGGNARAQVIEACAGADSVKLRLDNFLYGNVQWQQSDDNIEWEDIEYATDTVYVFKPERTRYYRAMVFYESCPFDTSQATLVRVTAQADAGPDKIVQTGLPTFLYGNMEDDAWGEWTFLEGTGGVLSDSTDNMPVFTGTDTLYRLMWTLHNVCGATSDTVEVQYVESEYYDAIVVVDTTDLIVSDASEMEVGFYKIVFNTPVPNITDTTVLIGVNHSGGFLRKVYYHEYHGDTCWMVTNQATLDDILISGVLCAENFDEMDHRRLPSQGKFVRLNHLITRADILRDSLFGMGRIVIYPKHSSSRSGDISIGHLDAPISLGTGITIEDSRFYFHPNFEFRYDKRFFVIPSIRFGYFNQPYRLEYDISISTPSLSITKEILIPFIPFTIGPLEFTLKIGVFAEAHASIDLFEPLLLTLGVSNTFTCNVSIPVTAVFSPILTPPVVDYHYGIPKFSIDFPVQMNNDRRAVVDLFFGSIVALSLYDVLFDFYIRVGPYFSLEACANNSSSKNGTTIQFSKGRRFDLGVRTGKLFKLYNPLSFDISNSWIHSNVIYTFPHNMTMVSGNNQILIGGQPLPQPLQVKLPSIKLPTLFPYPSFHTIPPTFVPVHFEVDNPFDGSTVSNPHTFPNTSGIAQTIWTPATPDSRVKAVVYDCDQNVLHQQTFKTVRASCLNSTLNLTKKKVGEQWTVYATGGHPPYTFYLDGVSTGSTPPIITPEPGLSHHFVVVDATFCSASADIKTEPFSCNSSTLSLGHSTSNIEGFANPVLFLFAEGGTPPYSYLLDGDPNSMVFQPDPTYYGLTPGNHTAYVKDSLGCVRSCSFKTDPVEPKEVIVVTMGVDNVADHSAKAHTTLYTEDPSYVLHRGVCWDILPNPTVLHPTLDYTTACTQCVYDYDITGLATNTTYYVRAYAITPNDTIYGNNTHFHTTAPYLPNIITDVSNITYTSARVGGNVLTDGGSPVSSRGVCWGTTLNPSSGAVHTINCGSGLGEFSTTITGLVPGTYYYARAFATNSSGTAYGDSIGFYPLNPSAPEVETDSVYNVTSSSATASGRVTYSNGDSVHTRGFCWSLSTNPTLSDDVVVCGSDTGHFDAVISGLLPDTTYYLKAFAINNVDTGYGVIIPIPTDTLAPDTLTPDTTVIYGVPCDPPTLTDYDNNVYHAVQIGSQCWMQENLRTTHFANGNSIAMGHTGSSTSDAYRYPPENDMNKVPLYGYLYNWSAVVNGNSGSSSNPSGLQGICPNGWHVPSNAEWNDLANTLGINYSCGGDAQNIAKALASTTNDWYTDNSNACAVGNNPALNNQSGFTAMPAGFFTGGSMPSDIGPNAYFATSTAGSSFLSYFVTVRYISYSQSTLQSNQELKSSAFSVRCVRNQ